MNEERIAKALRILREEGLEVRLVPAAVFVKVNRLDIASPDATPGGTRVILDGKEFAHYLSAIKLSISVAELTTATIELGVVP